MQATCALLRELRRPQQLWRPAAPPRSSSTQSLHAHGLQLTRAPAFWPQQAAPQEQEATAQVRFLYPRCAILCPLIGHPQLPSGYSLCALLICRQRNSPTCPTRTPRSCAPRRQWYPAPPHQSHDQHLLPPLAQRSALFAAQPTPPAPTATHSAPSRLDADHAAHVLAVAHSARSYTPLSLLGKNESIYFVPNGSFLVRVARCLLRTRVQRSHLVCALQDRAHMMHDGISAVG